MVQAAGLTPDLQFQALVRERYAGNPQAMAALGGACELGDQQAMRQLDLLRAMHCDTPQALRDWVASAGTRELNAAPLFIACADFLPPALCAHLIDRARPKLVPAQVNDAGGAGLKLDPMRTNTGAAFSLLETDLVMQLIRARIALTAKVAAATLEPAEVLHYSVGCVRHPSLKETYAKAQARQEWT